MKTAALVCGVFALMSAVATSSIDAELACETARMVVRLRATPDATPKTTVCLNCNGTGKIGDNTKIVMTCPVCNGTGKPVVSVLKRPDCERCGL
jgi:DnaJ-class molecular chaperone